MAKHTSQGFTLALKPWKDVSRSPKQRYQWPHKRTDVLQNFFKKLKKMKNIEIENENEETLGSSKIAHFDRKFEIEFYLQKQYV